MEEKYKFYGLGWMSEALGYYYPAMVREFYMNYIAILEGLCKKGWKPLEMQMQKRIPVQGKMVDILEKTINRMLYGPDFTPSGASSELGVKVFIEHGSDYHQGENCRAVKKADKQDKQLKLFAEQLGLFINRSVTTYLEPYKHFHARMDDMEARVNDRLKDLTLLESARVAVELKKA
ncbi:hypothetical protein HAX54_041999 [Datura stramonium]|uniref:Uncharacterized protein n=1 Tax=Datura stramonium TaxID=4076 RepID=A0ABS8SLR5_DATST|nr:hypothetical protein [Datura stramonium]